MPWFYVDDQFADSKPVVAMPDRYRLAACGLWLLAGSWSAREKLDGYVPKGKLRQLLADTRQPLVEVLKSTDGTYEPLWEDGKDGGGQLTLWDRWQPNAAQLQRKREANAARVRASRERKGLPLDDPRRKGRRHLGSQNGSAPAPEIPELIELANNGNALHRGSPYPDPLVVTYGGGCAVGSGSPNGAPAPPPPCPDHPKPDHAVPCRACQRVRQWRDSEALNAREAAVQAERERNEWERGIHRCELCNDTGMIFRPGPNRETEPPMALYVRCPHRVDKRREILQAHEAKIAEYATMTNGAHTEEAHA